MADKSKFFRVAVEGGTTDGRIIERSWLEEMAATYVPATYGARVNMEHIKGYSADTPFCAYGDVLALKTEEIDLVIGGKTEKRLALFAQIDPTEELLKVNARRQKVYTSIEIEPNFRGTGKCYLMGLAITDNPASLGTEMLQFVAGAPAVKAEFDKRKTSSGNLFTAVIETAIEFETAAAADDAGGLASVLKTLFANLTGTSATPAPVNPALANPLPSPGQGGATTQADQAYAAQFAAFQKGMEAIADGIDTARKADLQRHEHLAGEFAKLRSTLDATPAFTASGKRPAATGGSGVEQTDC